MKCSGNVAECALLVCVLSQPVPPSIHPSLHLVEYLLEIFLNFLRAPMNFMYTNEANNALCPHNQKALELCRSSQQSTKALPQRIPWLYWGCFKCNTYRITVLGWLNKEDEKF